MAGGIIQSGEDREGGLTLLAGALLPHLLAPRGLLQTHYTGLWKTLSSADIKGDEDVIHTKRENKQDAKIAATRIVKTLRSLPVGCLSEGLKSLEKLIAEHLLIWYESGFSEGKEK